MSDCITLPANTDHGYVRRHKDYAHRLAWIEVHGPIPPDKQLDHLCRVRNCVNVEHLELVSSRINTLRGTGPTAINAQKTHCKRGHPLSGDNLSVARPGSKRTKGRYCKACARETTAANKARRLAKAGGAL